MKTAQTPELRLLRPSFWQREHHLDKMTLARAGDRLFHLSGDHRLSGARGRLDRRLHLAAGAARRRPCSRSPRRASPIRSSGICIHRYVLHSRWMWRHKWMALDLEADPLRSSPGPEPSRGAVRRAPHDAADDRARRDPDRLWHRRDLGRRPLGGAAAALRHRPASRPASTSSSTASSTSPTSPRTRRWRT